MREIIVSDDVNQRFSIILNNRRCTIRLRYNVRADRWFMDVSRDDTPLITGRKIVTGVDLLQPFALGLGSIVAVTNQPGAVPDRDGLPSGKVRLYNFEPGELQL